MFCISCGAEMNDDATACPKCGHQKSADGASAPPPPPPPPTGDPVATPGRVQQKMIYPTEPPKNLVAATTLACICGLGQLYLGQMMKGIAMLVGGVLLTAVTGGAMAPILAIVSMLDAYFIGKKLEAGNAVAEWEFF